MRENTSSAERSLPGAPDEDTSTATDFDYDNEDDFDDDNDFEDHAKGLGGGNRECAGAACAGDADDDGTAMMARQREQRTLKPSGPAMARRAAGIEYFAPQLMQP